MENDDDLVEEEQCRVCGKVFPSAEADDDLQDLVLPVLALEEPEWFPEAYRRCRQCREQAREQADAMQRKILEANRQLREELRKASRRDQ